MNLSEDIYSYYFNNRNLLTDDKLFHFATRITAWFGKEETRQILREKKEFIVQPELNLDYLINEIVNTPQVGKRNAHELRQPFFNKYPLLYGAHLALFRVRHLKEVYGIDARDSLFKSIPRKELIDLRDSLLEDEEALRILSTFAINYVYLVDKIILEETEITGLERFLEVGKGYKDNSVQSIQLMIYLYTHCIIGDSNFYTKEISENSRETYIQMLKIIEKTIEDNFEFVNLDNKLEFLVCARICNFKTTISNRIYDECDNSISSDGTFLIDIHNKNAQQDRNSFSSSEHRNVLYIMSTSKYKPNSTLV